jgi:hypothetical protein
MVLAFILGVRRDLKIYKILDVRLDIKQEMHYG